jgi:hypothetical protein
MRLGSDGGVGKIKKREESMMDVANKSEESMK